MEFGFATTHQDIEDVAAEHDGLGLYLRSLSGLDREAASTALDQFQQGRTLTASQHHFIGLLTDALARRGVVDVGAVYDPPFSGLASGGPDDLFGEKDVDEIVAILHRVRSTAVPVAS